MNRTKSLASFVCAAMLTTTALATDKPAIPTSPASAEAALSHFQATPAAKSGQPLTTTLAAPHGAGTGGGTFDEDEPNDAFDTADYARDSPFTARGAITPGDADVYSVDVEAGQRFEVHVLVSLLGSPLDPTVVVYYPHNGGTDILASNDDNQGNLDSFVEFTAPETGRISFVVQSAIGSQGGSDFAYRLWVLPAGGSRIVEAEPNDEASQADQVGLPALYFTKIGHAGDADWVQFQASAGEQLVVDVNAAEFLFPVDPVVELYDPSGRRVFMNDDAVQGDLDPAFNVKLPASGVYNLRCSDFRPDIGGNTNLLIVSISVQDGTQSPTVTGVKRNPAGSVKKVVGDGFAQALTVEIDMTAAASTPVPAKPRVRKLTPPAAAGSGSIVTVVNGNGRRSNPYVIP